MDESKAGSISKCLDEWKALTSDYHILSTVSGLPLQFEEDPPCSSTVVPSMFNTEENQFVITEINRLLLKGIIVKCQHEVGEFISPIFLTPKSDGGYRLILNLKRLNGYMPYIHFKMDTVEKVLQLVKKGAFMAKIDLKDAYYSVKIKDEHQKFLKFVFKGSLYKFTCLPNGLCTGPRKFTKLLKPPLSYLRVEELMLISAYIDDIITLNDTFGGCFSNVEKILSLFSSLGFIIHPHKSCFVPSQRIEYLGVIIDSIHMTVSLTYKKKVKIFELCKQLLVKKKCLVRDIAKLLGYMSYGFISVKYGKMHYRNLEHVKIRASSQGNFDTFTELTLDSIDDIIWWKNNIFDAYDDIYKDNPVIVLTTDASLTGWGAVTEYNKCGGLFSKEESKLHINVLELKAILFGLKSLLSNTSNCCIKILSDNSTAVGCINNMGSCKSKDCNRETIQIWEWAIYRDIWLIASHIPGVLNVEADFESRRNETQLEWKLNERILSEIIDYFGFTPNIDLFASRINKQFSRFVSFRPDLESVHVNAFTISWTNLDFYAFPPFSCVSKVIQKIRREKCIGILIIPNWTNQLWFPVLQELMLIQPYFIPSSVNQLHLPTKPLKRHPLHQTLELLACLVDTRREL